MHAKHGECWRGLRAAFISTLPCWLLVLLLTTTGQAKGPTEAFLMAYFVGDSVEENRMHLCWSLDGLKWTALNNDNPVVTSCLGGHARGDHWLVVVQRVPIQAIETPAKVHTVVLDGIADEIGHQKSLGRPLRVSGRG